MNEREQAVFTARQILSDEQVTAFLRAVRGKPRPLAVKLINDQIDAGKSLDEIFYDGEKYGYRLLAKRISKSELKISFGCQAGSLAGDGGNWLVTFNGNSVHSAGAETVWIS